MSTSTQFLNNFQRALPLLTSPDSSLFETIYKGHDLTEVLPPFLREKEFDSDAIIEQLKQNGFLIQDRILKWNKNLRVLILGFGFAGRDIARNLHKSKTVDVTIVNDHDYFESKPAVPFVMVDHEKEKKFRKPISSYMKDPSFILGSVSEVSQEGNVSVQTQSEIKIIERWEYDILVASTGCDTNIDLFKSDNSVKVKKGQWMSEFLGENDQDVDKAEKIAVIGGGPVAVEIVFELAHKYPQKQIHVFISKSWLPRISGAHKAVQGVAKKYKNVHVHENTRVVELKERSISANDFDKGQDSVVHVQDFDLVIACTGLKPLTSFLPSSLLSNGWVDVYPTLQSKKWPFLFAAGDISSIEVERTAASAMEQGHYVWKSLLSLSKGVLKMGSVTPAPPMMIISIGPTTGLLVKSGRASFNNWFILKAKMFVETSVMK